MFTLKQLDLFLLLAQHEKIVEVSKLKKMSQSAISMSIKSLEDDLGVKLFNRIGKKLVLNEKGKQFLIDIKPSFTNLHTIYKNFSSRQLYGELHIAASKTIADYLMPSIISSYLSVNDTVKIVLKSVNSDEVMRMLKAGECDIGFIESDFKEEQIEYTTIMIDELVVVSANKKFAQERSYFIDTLSDEKWVMREPGSGTRSVFLNTIAPETINIELEFQHTSAIINFLLLEQRYISALPKISVQDAIAEGKLFEVQIKNMKFSREFKLVLRKSKSSSTLVSHFKNHVLSQSRSL